MRQIDLMMAFEDGTLEANKVIELFADLVKTGMAFQLQGFYGRTAMALIDAGYINRSGEVLRLPEEE